jgi:hypothetical protein
VNDQVWARLFKQANDRGFVSQIEVAAAGDDDGWAPVHLDLPHHMGPQKSGPPGH